MIRLLYFLIFLVFFFRLNANGGEEDMASIDWSLKHNGVFIILGQSNAANHLNKKYIPKNKFYTINNSKMTICRDPIPGCTGDSGNIWTIISDKLIERKIFDNILLINIAVGGSKVSDWNNSNVYWSKVEKCISELSEKLILADYVVWWQGESDTYEKNSYQPYKENLRELTKKINTLSQNSKLLITQTSYHPEFGINIDIRNAQIEVINENNNMYFLIDTDKYLNDYRYDDLHFTQNGAFVLAENIINRLKEIME